MAKSARKNVSKRRGSTRKETRAEPRRTSTKGNLALAIREAVEDRWKGTAEELDKYVRMTQAVITMRDRRLYAKLEAFVADIRRRSTLTIAGLIIPERTKLVEGTLVRSVSVVWNEIVRKLGEDWSVARDLSPEQWEQLVAGAFKKAGYDEVILTKRSGDLGRDVIATTKGVGQVKIIGSVKAYKPGHLVKHDDVRALLGTLNGERNASKAILTTTSDFAPGIHTDPFIEPYLPTRLELLNGEQLQAWLTKLLKE
jgi:restriction system protein